MTTMVVVARQAQHEAVAHTNGHAPALPKGAWQSPKETGAIRQRLKTDHNAVWWQLTPPQEAAIDCLMSGLTVTQTARTLGCNRSTVSLWLHHHDGFQMALACRRQELWASMAERLRALIPKALLALDRELDGPSPMPAILLVLKASRLLEMPPLPGLSEIDNAQVAGQRYEDEQQDARKLQRERVQSTVAMAMAQEASARREPRAKGL